VPQDRLQQQRFELKYLVDEAITPGLRDFISCYLEVDDYGVGRPNFAYPVYSVYLDSDGLKTYQDTINGTKNRYKLRLRYYDDRADTPVFFEIKGRVDNCILKQRCGVRREAIPTLLAGHLPEADHLLSPEPKHLVALQRFNMLMNQLGARPKAHNSYLREAWVSPHDNSVRVTFDRNVHIEPFFKLAAPLEMTQPFHVYSQFTILELKFTSRFPDWFQEMVRRFNLTRGAAAKYAEGVFLVGDWRFRNTCHMVDEQGAIAAESAPQMLPNRMQGAFVED
jgi:hypothetical protein